MLPYLLPLAVVSPSLVWLARDESVWTWDQAWYGKGSVDLFYTIVYTPADWVPQMQAALYAQAPGVSWVGQFFVPLGLLIHSFDDGLLVSILVTQALTLLLTYRSLLELSGGRHSLAVPGCVMIASAPLFVALSHQFFAEPLQLLAVAWFVLLMTFAPRWSPAFTLTQLWAAAALAMLAKVSSPLYCLGPGLAALWCVFKPRAPSFARSEWQNPRVLATLAGAIVLTLAAVGWYRRNLAHVVYHVSAAATGPIAEIYGRRDSFLNTMAYWLGALRDGFFLPWALAASVAAFLSAVVAWVIGRKRPPAHLTACSLVALAQMAVVLGTLSLSANEDTRYLLPLAPHVALLVGWTVSQIGRPLMTGLAILIFSLQLADTHARALGIVRGSSAVRWLLPPAREPREAAILESLVARTCTSTGSVPYLNIIGIELPWLNQNSASYFAAKVLGPRRLVGCSYGSVYSFSLPEPDEIWRSLLAANIRYYVTKRPSAHAVRSADPHLTAINRNYLPVLRILRASGAFTLEPSLPEDPEILIFRSKANP